MDFPSYTAYVPVYNQAATLGAALASLRAQSAPPAEILVVDDGSTDDSAKIAEAAGATVLRQGVNQGRGAARARAYAAAKHELVLGCDAGDRLPADFAARALKYFLDTPRLGTVGGWFLQSKTGGVVQRWRSRHLFARPAPSLLRGATLVTAGYLARRRAVLAVGNYDAKMRAGEDAELGRRLQAAGWEVWLDPDLGVESLTGDTAASVFERYARWNETAAPTPETNLWRDYLKRCAYAVKVLAVRDLRAGDWSSVPLSLALPHYLARRAWKRKKNAAASLRRPVVHYVNTYSEPWLDRCRRGEDVSRAHLWGTDALEAAGFDVRPVRSRAAQPWLRILRGLSSILGGRLGDLAADWLVLSRLKTGDIVYVAAGQLVFTPLAVRCGWVRAKLVAWFYQPAAPFSWRSWRGLSTARPLREAYAGWLALTPHVEAWLRREHPRARVRRVVWSADTVYYPSVGGAGSYFAATGATQRDYAVLLAAARAVDFPLVVIGPAEWQAQAPANVEWRVRNRLQPHATIDDRQLRELYQGARAILIPLLPDPDDASGFTNLLEAIASGRPVVMTRTGALDVTPGALGIGYEVAPGDAAGWVTALQTLANEPETAARFATRAAELARDYFNLPRFEKDLVGYFLDLTQNRPEPPTENVVAKLSKTTAPTLSTT